MSDEEFRAVVIELARHPETKEQFNTDALRLRHRTGLSKLARQGRKPPEHSLPQCSLTGKPGGVSES